MLIRLNKNMMYTCNCKTKKSNVFEEVLRVECNIYQYIVITLSEKLILPVITLFFQGSNHFI